MTLSIRQAVDGDVPAIARVGAQAFPGADARTRERQIREHPLAAVSDILVAQDAGRIVGTATVIPFEAWWAGQRWRAGGLASVAVAPEARRRGIASTLCKAAVAWLREQGVPLCLLYPFDVRFYADRGWHVVGLSRRVLMKTSWLPASKERVSLEWIDPTQGTEALALCHAMWLHRRGVGLERSPNAWKRLAGQGWQWFGLPGTKGLEGHLAMSDSRDPVTHRHTIRVAEMVAAAPEAWMKLLAFLHDQEAQSDWVELDLPAETPIELLAVNPMANGESDLGNGHFAGSHLVTGAMVRVLDWPQMLAALPARAEMPLPPAVLEVAGLGRWRLEPNGQIQPAADADGDAVLSLGEGTFTQILWGAMTVSQALAWGRAHLSAAGRVDVGALDAALAQPPLFIPLLDDF